MSKLLFLPTAPKMLYVSSNPLNNPRKLTAGGEDCDCCPNDETCLNCCENDLASHSFQVEVSGVGNGSCRNCGVFNGTFICDFIGGCRWRYDGLAGSFPCDPHCSYTGYEVYIHCSVSNYYLDVYPYGVCDEPPLCDSPFFQKVRATAWNCTTFDGENIPLIPGTCCSGGTCVLTSL